MLARSTLPKQNRNIPSMRMTPRQNQKKLNKNTQMLRNRRRITDDGNGLPVPSMFILMDTIPIGHLTPTHIHPFFITPTTHFTDTGIIILGTTHRITVTIAATIRTETSIDGIIVVVGIHPFHDGLTKEVICDSTIDVLAVHAA